MPRRRPSTTRAGGPGAGGGGGLGVALALAALLLAAALAAAPPAAGSRWGWEEEGAFEWVELEPDWGAQAGVAPVADAPLGASFALGGARGLQSDIPRCKCNCKNERCKKKLPGEKKKRYVPPLRRRPEAVRLTPDGNQEMRVPRHHRR